MSDSFGEVLRDIASRMPGVVALSLVGSDGIPVETIGANGEPPIEPIGAELTGFLKNLVTADMVSQPGTFRQLDVETKDQRVFLAAVTPEYYLLLLVSQDANQGRATYELKRAASRLERELS